LTCWPIGAGSSRSSDSTQRRGRARGLLRAWRWRFPCRWRSRHAAPGGTTRESGRSICMATPRWISSRVAGAVRLRAPDTKRPHQAAM
jgi:hypothetical protein